jgi:hypothetical protein
LPDTGLKSFIACWKVRKVTALAGAALIIQTRKPGKKAFRPPFEVYLKQSIIPEYLGFSKESP